MVKFLRRVFRKPNKPLTIKDLKIGDIVQLTYKHPKDVGVITDNSLSVTRLNETEINGDRTIKGMVSNTYHHDFLLQHILEIRVFQMRNERVFLFLENEIESFRVIV